MSAYVNTVQNRFTFWLVVLLVTGGLTTRFPSERNVTFDDADTRTAVRLAQFLVENDMPDARWVHYTQDSGIRGLQITLPECRGSLQIAVMPEGDEFLALWETRSFSAGYTSAYLFDKQIYPDFPLYIFWLKTMTHALARRLQLSVHTNPGPVLALAHPEGCPVLEQIPWIRFTASG
ncbi:MAG: hypothetical protein GY703_23140 [Gammaproteobacteria bacterium]|nr:hypothetical protein [Gammaproteobacteria bacterium]